MFEVAADDVAGELFESAFDRWFEQALGAPGEGLRRLLRRREGFDREGPRPIIRAAAWELLQWRDFHTPWSHRPFDRDPEIDALVEDIRALGALIAPADPPIDQEDWLGKALGEIVHPIDEATRLESVRGRDYDALEAALLALLRGYDGRWRWKGWGENFGPLPRVQVMARRDALKARLARFRDAAGANLAPLLRDELWPIVGYYEEAKKRAGVLDFMDLLLVARDLVRDRAAMRAELQHRISHIFVDEFQDTDPLQAEILLLLAADDPAESDWHRARPLPGKLFIVGDPKQSIYRFRRADVALYQEVKRRLLECGAELEHLTVSFRATPELQAAVNAAFAPLMPSESPTQPAYSPLMPFRADCATQPSLVVLPVPAPFSDRGFVTKRQIDESTPDAAGALVRWLVEESGWTVTTRDRPEERVAIEPRHICMLFRRFSAYGRDVTRPYVRALEARHIAHVWSGADRSTSARRSRRCATPWARSNGPTTNLRSLRRCADRCSRSTTARCCAFARRPARLHPFRNLPADLPPSLRKSATRSPCCASCSAAQPPADRGDHRAPARRGARARGIAIWPTGEQALANVMRLMDLARRYEARRAVHSFRGFVDELEARAEREESGEAPVVEEGAEGVRIMTVHRAKGLEFPIVLLADMTCNETVGDAHRWVDPASGLCALRLAGHAPARTSGTRRGGTAARPTRRRRACSMSARRARATFNRPPGGRQRAPGGMARAPQSR